MRFESTNLVDDDDTLERERAREHQFLFQKEKRREGAQCCARSKHVFFFF